MTKSNTHSKIKIVSKLGIERNFLNLKKNIHKKPTANIIINGETLEVFLLKSKTREKMILFTTPFPQYRMF